MTYPSSMSALVHGRLWRALIAVAFLLATAAPTVASSYRSDAATPPCAGHDMGGKGTPDCSGHAAKATACGLIACAGLAIAVPDRSQHVEQSAWIVSFPPARLALMTGAVLPPDPFPPRTPRLA